MNFNSLHHNRRKAVAASPRKAAMRKPPKRVDPMVAIPLTITTSQYLKLHAYSQSTGLKEMDVLRAAIAHFVDGISEWQR